MKKALLCLSLLLCVSSICYADQRTENLTVTGVLVSGDTYVDNQVFLGTDLEVRLIGNSAGDLLVQTGDGASTEKMRVAAGGNVGIGTTNPQKKLEVAGAISATGDSDVTVTCSGGETIVIGTDLTSDGTNLFWKGTKLN